MLKPGKKVLSLFLSLFLVIPLLAFSGMQASAATTEGVSSEESILAKKPPVPDPEPVLTKTATLVTGTTNTWEITVTVSGKKGVVSDPIGSMFDLVISGGKSKDFDTDDYTASEQTSVIYDNHHKTLSWFILTESKVTLTYRVKIDDHAKLGETYKTNGTTTFYYDIYKTKDFDVPTVKLPYGSIQVKGYLVDKDGKPIDKDGNTIGKDGKPIAADDYVVVYDQPFTPNGSASSKLGTGTYNVSAPPLSDYNTYPGQKTQKVELNPSNTSSVVWFKYSAYQYWINHYKLTDPNTVLTSTGPFYGQKGVITFSGPKPDIKELDGYKLDNDSTKPLTITKDARSNILKAFYVKDSFNYTINYFKIGEVGSFTQSKGTALFEDPITADSSKRPDGYKFDHDDGPKKITSTEANNILNVYFVKDTFNYTVEYYKDNETKAFDTYNNSALFQTVINDYPDRAPVGYVRSDITGKPLTITSDPAKNVIKVYYVKGTFGYTVNYFKDGSGTPFAQSSLSAKFGDVINSYENKAPTGYVLDTASGLPLTIGTVESRNVINVNYKKGSFAYKIEYYKEGSNTPFDTATGKGIFGDIISTYGDKTPSGYTFSRVVGGPLTISENEGNNVIKVYYKLVPVTPTTGESSNKTLLPMLFACGSLCGGLVIKKESLRKKTQA